jgi:hypothetical protein
MIASEQQTDYSSFVLGMCDICDESHGCGERQNTTGRGELSSANEKAFIGSAQSRKESICRVPSWSRGYRGLLETGS